MFNYCHRFYKQHSCMSVQSGLTNPNSAVNSHTCTKYAMDLVVKILANPLDVIGMHIIKLPVCIYAIRQLQPYMTTSAPACCGGIWSFCSVVARDSCIIVAFCYQ